VLLRKVSTVILLTHLDYIFRHVGLRMLTYADVC
jgi:hypothetical protein